MAEYSKIDYLLARDETEEPGGTWSPWIGCDKGDRAGCAHCWAEAWARRSPRFRGHWGPNAPRYLFGDEHWKQPLKWQRKCERLGRRKRVLVSLCDPFEVLPSTHQSHAPMAGQRQDFWWLIEHTPSLDWLVLTKRPEEIGPLVPRQWRDPSAPHARAMTDREPGSWPPNLWLGVSAWDQPSADRNIPLLLEVPAAVRWVSLEPLLGPVDASRWMAPTWGRRSDGKWGCDSCCTGDRCDAPRHVDRGRCEACKGTGAVQRLDWGAVGCESRGAHPGRHCEVTWAEALREQCRGAGVPMFAKQLELPAWPGRLVRSEELAAYGWPVELPPRNLLTGALRDTTG
jgi:protein gp37